MIEAVDIAQTTVRDPSLAASIDRARKLAREGVPTPVAADELGNTGFVIHTVPLATFVALRFGDDARASLVEAVGAGGATDSIAAIVGAWVGPVTERRACRRSSSTACSVERLARRTSRGSVLRSRKGSVASLRPVRASRGL